MLSHEVFLDDSGFQGPYSFCTGPESSIFVVDEIKHSVSLWDKDQKKIWETGTKGNKPGQFFYPIDAVFFQGFFWVVDRYNHRIQILDSNGKLEGQFGSYGTNSGFLNEPSGICAIDDFLCVSDTENQKIKFFDIKGSFLREIGSPGPAPEYYESPFFKSQAVFQKWTSKQTRFHTLESQFFESGFFTGNLEYPKGIAVGNDSLVVADFSGRIQIFSFEGVLQASFANLPECEWVQVYEGKIFFSSPSHKQVFELNKDGVVSEYFEGQREIGKFLISEGKLLYLAPWEKKIFCVTF